MLYLQADKVTADVNFWVYKSTNGVTKGIFDTNLPPETSIVLANALYFKGEWSTPFKKSQTEEKDFHFLNGETALVPFLSKAWKRYMYATNEDFKLLELPYASGQDQTRRFSMYIFLPHETDGLNNLIQKYFTSGMGFNPQKFGLKLVDLRELRVPKFKFSSTLNPADVIKNLGLSLPFEDRGDFNGIVDSPVAVPLEGLIQISNIEVNEKGTEAASVCSMFLMGCSLVEEEPPPPEDFIADHPFVFMIREDISGTIFFLGAVLNPLLLEE